MCRGRFLELARGTLFTAYRASTASAAGLVDARRVHADARALRAVNEIGVVGSTAPNAVGGSQVRNGVSIASAQTDGGQTVGIRLYSG